MEIYRSAEEIPSPPAARVIALGNFDGLHLGHLRIIKTLKAEALARRLPACMVTFSPHPEKVFGAGRLCMIQTLDQRLRGLRELGADEVVVLPFNRPFARLAGAVFASTILAGRLNARAVVVGRDFRFGHGRTCGLDDLKRFGRENGFDVRAVPDVRRGRRIVRSSRIREFLAAGRIEDANELLGRPYAVEGDVVRGRRIGRRLGYPTANLQSPNEILPRGIFITLLTWQGRRHPSITNIGTRPTFGRQALSIECHLLDFDRDLYGQNVRLDFLRKLRKERSFTDAASLEAQIGIDAAAARVYFRRRPHL